MSEDAFDIISIGDTTMDIFLKLEEASVSCELDTHNCKLLLNYADKIPVESVTHIPGVGNAANNAVGSARLGLKTALYTIVGDDITGKQTKDHLCAQGVSCDYIEIDRDHSTNLSVVLNFQAERTILVHHEPRVYNLPDLPITKWIYFSSIASGHENLHNQIPEYIRRTEAKLGFNPGTFQLKDGLDRLRSILQVTTFFILNMEEARKFLQTEEPDVKKLLISLQELGPKIIVITDGPKGAYALSESTIYFQPILEGPVIERTGAGDAFATACLAALIHGEDLKEALRWGTLNSWSVLQYIGAQEGLLTKERLTSLLQEHPKLQAEII